METHSEELEEQCMAWFTEPRLLHRGHSQCLVEKAAARSPPRGAQPLAGRGPQNSGLRAHEARRAQRIFVFTYLPSPYQVELFDAVAASGVDLFVLYACRHHATPIAQNWTIPHLAHAHAFADAPGFQVREMFARLERSDLYVMNYYRHPVASALAAAAPAFWQEPGAFGESGRERGFAACWAGFTAS